MDNQNVEKSLVNNNVSTTSKEDLTQRFKELLNEMDFDVYKDSNGCYRLYDIQGANLGGIEEETFEDAGEIADRLNIYYEDYFFKDLEEKFESYKDELNLNNEQMPYNMEDWINFYDKLKNSNPEIVEGLEYSISYFRTVVEVIDNPEKVNLDEIIIDLTCNKSN